MRMLRCWIALMGWASLAAAQGVPAGWKVVKDEKGVCQFAVPPEWKPAVIANMLEDPRQMFTAMVVEEEYFQFKPMSAEEVQAHKPARVVENSRKRIFLMGAPRTLVRSTSSTWMVWVPSAKASCHLTLTLKAGADEVLAAKVADTLRAK